MPPFSANGAQDIPFDARQRLTPTLHAHSVPLLTLRHSPSAGYGVFASESIKPNTLLLESDGPAAYVIYHAFRKEVCAWCFRYEQGRNWKIRFPSENSKTGSGAAGIVFCIEDCRDAWRHEYGDVAVEAFAAVENLVLKQARNKGWTIDLYQENDENVPNEKEVEEAWETTEEQANFIRTLRQDVLSFNSRPPEALDLHTPLSQTSRQKHPSKLQRQAFAKTIAQPVLSSDTLFFLLSGVLCASSSFSSSQWRPLLTLNPSLHLLYPNMNAVRQVTTSFLHLTAVLPIPLLPFVTRETCEAILARDVGNSFGIWSTNTKPGCDLNPLDVQRMHEEQEGAEMLGYGIWPIASFFNHSCVPNVSRRRVGRRWAFFTARNVTENEELCISYIRGEEDTLNLVERRKRLSDAWGFTCHCEKCIQEEERERNKKRKE